jgi:hypothetical protein
MVGCQCVKHIVYNCEKDCLLLPIIVILDIQVFRKFVQIQGGKKLTAGIHGVFRGSIFFPTPELGKLTKT